MAVLTFEYETHVTPHANPLQPRVPAQIWHVIVAESLFKWTWWIQVCDVCITRLLFLLLIACHR
jgi:hypothetical protein